MRIFAPKLKTKATARTTEIQVSIWAIGPPRPFQPIRFTDLPISDLSRFSATPSVIRIDLGSVYLIFYYFGRPFLRIFPSSRLLVFPVYPRRRFPALSFNTPRHLACACLGAPFTFCRYPRIRTPQIPASLVSLFALRKLVMPARAPKLVARMA